MNISSVTREYNLEGIRLFIVKTNIKKVVTIQGSFLGGNSFAPKNNPLLPLLTIAMLDKGTQKHSKEYIREKLESMGASIGFSCGNERIQFSIKCLKENISSVITLLSEQLRTPRFSGKEFTKAKKMMTARLYQNQDDTNCQAETAFLENLYSKDHINYVLAINDQIKFVQKAIIADVKKYYTTTFGSNELIFVATGDIEDSAMRSEITKAFSRWGSKTLKSRLVKTYKLTKQGIKHKYISIPSKLSADVYIGNTVPLTIAHPDYFPFILGLSVLGGGMLTSRLIKELRIKRGLTYVIRTALSGFKGQACGHWYAWGTFAPANLQMGFTKIKEQILNIVEGGVTQKELTHTKGHLIGVYAFRLSTTGGLAAAILSAIEDGHIVQYIDNFPKRINDVTLKQTNKVIKKYIKPSKLLFVAAGSVNKQGKPL